MHVETAPSRYSFLLLAKLFSWRLGALICEYVGEVVSWEVFRKRMEKEYNHNLHHYCLKLDSNKVIDAYSQGGIGRFINHSCEPNSQTQKWVVQGQDRMAIFATEDIPAGEEITYDYKFESFDVQVNFTAFKI